MDGQRPPLETSNFYCLPGRAGGTPIGLATRTRVGTYGRSYGGTARHGRCRLSHATGIAMDPRRPLFHTIGRDQGQPPTRTPLPNANAYATVGRRAAATGITAKLGNHCF
jgi:hypothetical protein